MTSEDEITRLYEVNRKVYLFRAFNALFTRGTSFTGVGEHQRASRAHAGEYTSRSGASRPSLELGPR